jgi:hypothetical protein
VVTPVAYVEHDMAGPHLIARDNDQAGFNDRLELNLNPDAGGGTIVTDPPAGAATSDLSPTHATIHHAFHHH